MQAKKRRARDAAVSAEQMGAALAAGGGGVTWGFGEDAEEEDPEASAAFVDWRTYSETKGLTDKQAPSPSRFGIKDLTDEQAPYTSHR